MQEMQLKDLVMKFRRFHCEFQTVIWRDYFVLLETIGADPIVNPADESLSPRMTIAGGEVMRS